MTQYDAGPGDWTDREWEAPDRKRPTHAKPKRFPLPPWALLAAGVAAVVLLCVGFVMVVRGIRNRGTETPVAAATGTVQPVSTGESTALEAAPAVSPTATLVIPGLETETQSAPTEIAVGVQVVVQNTQGAGLNLRKEPAKAAAVVSTAKDGVALTVIEGPMEADGFTWWKLRTADGKEGWGAAAWLKLKTD